MPNILTLSEGALNLTLKVLSLKFMFRLNFFHGKKKEIPHIFLSQFLRKLLLRYFFLSINRIVELNR